MSNHRNNILKKCNIYSFDRLQVTQCLVSDIRVASRVVRRLKTFRKLQNIIKISKIYGLRILGNIKKKCQKCMEKEFRAQPPFQKHKFGQSSQISHRKQISKFLVKSSFAWFLYCFPLIFRDCKSTPSIINTWFYTWNKFKRRLRWVWLQRRWWKRWKCIPWLYFLEWKVWGSLMYN